MLLGEQLASHQSTSFWPQGEAATSGDAHQQEVFGIGQRLFDRFPQ